MGYSQRSPAASGHLRFIPPPWHSTTFGVASLAVHLSAEQTQCTWLRMPDLRQRIEDTQHSLVTSPASVPWVVADVGTCGCIPLHIALDALTLCTSPPQDIQRWMPTYVQNLAPTIPHDTTSDCTRASFISSIVRCVLGGAVCSGSRRREKKKQNTP
jgi:hypothetical protein